jgi:hypothetical protein
MKVGDRVKIARGEHQGRTGTITETAGRIEALDRVLRPSPVREILKSNLVVPAGCHAVALDEPSDGLTVARIEIFSVNLLIPVEECSTARDRQSIRVMMFGQSNYSETPDREGSE